MRNRRKTQLCPAGTTIIVGLLIGAAGFERDPFVTLAGALTMLAGLMTLCTKYVADVLQTVNRPADEAWTEGYESGYDKGWRDGHAVGRPTLTVMRKDDTNELGRKAAER